MKGTSRIALILAAAGLAGCLNMPTQTSQITGAYVNSLKYEGIDCPRLSVEYDSISRRESQLAIAQEQRVKTSKVQAFWYGFGQGDGIEAAELANVRGEREAVRKAMEVQKCQFTPTGGTNPYQLQGQMKYKPKL
jgi:hypothetical protein